MYFAVDTSKRGFEFIEALPYVQRERGPMRVLQQSSAIGDDENGPGSSFLWFGEDHHFDREQVMELAQRMLAWLTTGSLELKGDNS